jgi:hypothetical protein
VEECNGLHDVCSGVCDIGCHVPVYVVTWNYYCVYTSK